MTYPSYAEFKNGQRLSNAQLDQLGNEHPDVINQIANEKY